MIYIYVEGYDPCGEGTRAHLYDFGERANADDFWNSVLHNNEDQGDITKMIMIDGFQVNHYQAGKLAASDRELTSDDLQVSTLEDVDNLADKENV